MAKEKMLVVVVLPESMSFMKPPCRRSGHLSSEGCNGSDPSAKARPIADQTEATGQVVPVTVAPEVTIARVGEIYEGAHKRRCTLID